MKKNTEQNNRQDVIEMVGWGSIRGLGGGVVTTTRMCLAAGVCKLAKRDVWWLLVTKQAR